MGRAIALLVVAYCLWVAALYAVQGVLIFPGAFMGGAGPEAPPDPDVIQVWIEPEPGVRVEAWYQPGRGRTPESPGPAVLFFHGNGDRIDTRWNVGKPYRERGVSFLACEYRGYGRSGGRPSQRALVDDAERFRAWLLAQPEVDRAKLVYHGISLGGGVAVGLAERAAPGALVLESTFANVAGMARRYLVPEFLVKHPFRSDRIVATLNVPILLVHGRRDRVVPIEHSRRLQALARDATLVETDAGHDDYRTDWASIWTFLEARGLLR